MDRISLSGLLMGLVAVVGGQVLEGGSIGSLLQVTAFIIVMGGTMGATMLQHPPAIFWQGVKMLRWVFFPPQQSQPQVIEQIITWSQTARKGGLLSLEPIIEQIDDPFMKK